MSLGIRSGVNWIRLNSSASERASEWTISVFASPGTPSRMQCPRAKTAIRSCSTTSSWPTIWLAICARIWSWAVRSASSSARSSSSVVVLKVASLPLLALKDWKILERQLQDDGGDRGAVDLADPVAVPGAVGALHGEELVASLGEVGVPVRVARHVEPLRGIEVRVEGVAAPLVPLLARPELVPDVLEAVGGDRAVEL